MKEHLTVPASPQQEGVWFHALNSGSAYWNFIQKRSFRGALDIAALKRALAVIAGRHASLRSNFVLRDDELFQVIRPVVDVDEFFEHVKLDGGVDAVQRILCDEERRGFDFEKDVLFRLKLLEQGGGFLFVLTVSHIITDTASMQVFWNELARYYNSREGEILLPAKQYFDYALAQHEFARTPAYEKQKLYWLDKLSGELPAFDLALYKDHRIYHEEISLPEQLVQDVRTFSLRKRVLFSAVFQLAYFILLHKITGNKAIAIGNVVNGRGFGTNLYNDVIGLFAKRLVNTQVLSDEDTITDLLARVNGELLESFANSDVPYEEVVRDLNQKNKRGLSPLFQAVFNMVKASRQGATFGGLAEQQDMELDNGLVGDIQYDIGLSIIEQGGGARLRLDLKCGELYRPLISFWIQRYLKILGECVYGGGKKVGEIECGCDDELRLLERFNDTAVEYPRDKTLVDLIAEQVERTPHNTAVVFNEQQLSYKELDERSNQLAHYLSRSGVKEDSLVAICLERSIEMIVGIIGALKAGGAYVPIDPGYPVERISYMLEDTAAEVVIGSLPVDFKGKVISLNDVVGEPTSKLTTALKPNNLAYVIYTSGSTGRPKGVMNQHDGVVNRLLWMQDRFELSASDSVLQKTTFCFDVSVWELLWPLITGARLVFAEPGGHRNTQYLKQLIAEQAITTLHFVPSMLEVFLQDVEDGELKTLKNVMCSGEELKLHQAILFNEKLPHAALHNLYGPTEAAIDVTCWTVPQNPESISIGKPIANTQLYILDASGQPSPIGVSGELHIGGIQLARGYLNRPELTAEKFINLKSQTLYKTGDLARWLPDGNIEYLGRIDDQVKIRGYRIEPGEIASVVQQSGLVRQSVIVPKKDKTGLIGYVVADEGFDKEALISYLKKQLPEYMVPNLWVKLESIPLTSNGKLDKKNLPEADLAVNTYVAPGTELETLLVNIWQDLLGVDCIGINDNFFSLGGDSIVSMQVVSRIRRSGHNIRPRDIFTYQNIAQLSAAIQQMQHHNSIIAEQGILSGQSGLLPIQQSYLNRETNNPAIAHYNQAMMYNISRQVTGQALSKALQSLVSHHDALRYAYEQTTDGWRQQYGNHLPSLVIHDVSHHTKGHLPEVLLSIAQSEHESLNIQKGDNLRAVLFQMPGNEQHNRLLLVIHHLVIDGVSWRILSEDLELLLNNATLPAKKTSSYRDWYKALEQYGKSRRLLSQQTYWETIVSQAPVRKSPEPVSAKDWNTITVSLSAAHTQLLLQEVPQAYQTEINDILLSALSRTLGEWSGNSLLPIALEGHGREEEIAKGIDLSRTVGWFTTMCPVVLEWHETESTSSLIKRTKEQLRRIPDKGIGYGVLKYINKAETLSGQDPWEIVFNYLGQYDNIIKNDGHLSPANGPTGKGISDHHTMTEKMSVNSIVWMGELQLHWGFSGKHYTKQTIEALSANYINNLRQVIDHCIEAAKQGKAFTPSDYGLGAEISYQELDRFMDKAGSNNISSLYRLSALQEGMLFHSLYDENVKAYIEQFACDLANVHVETLLRSFDALIQRHSILRTAFYHEAFSIPVQCVLKKVKMPVQELDYRTLDKTLQQQAIRKYEEADRSRGFDFTQAPLMRLTLIRLSEHSYRMVWTSHHILFDGWSHTILVGELQRIYENLINGQPPHDKNTDNYHDYIRYTERQDRHEEEHWWREYMNGIERPVLLPFIARRADRNKGLGQYEQLGIELDNNFTRKLQQYIQKHRITVNTLMQGVWAYLLYRYTGEEEITYGVTVSGRPEELPGVEDRVGLYINTLPLHTRVKEDLFISEWLAELQAAQASSRQYQYSKLSDIGRWTGLGTDMFDSILVFENYLISKDAYSKEWRLQLDAARMHEQTNYPLALLVAGSQDLWINFSYNAELLQRSRVSQISSHFNRVLTQIIEEEPAQINALQMLVPQEEEQLLKHFNGEPLAYPKEKTLIELFNEQANKAPANTALVYGTDTLTYGELDERSSQLAHYLGICGIRQESLVMICMDRSLEMMVGILGILKAGGAYVPVDPESPLERISYLLNDTGAKILLTNAHCRQAIPNDYAGKLIVIDEEWNVIRRQPVTHPVTASKAGNLAYVIYTSGSTGRPKGVMVTHQNVLAMLFGFRHVAPPGNKAGAGLMLCPYVFDVSVWEIFINLCFGDALHIPVRGDAIDEAYVANYLIAHPISTAYIPPGFLPGIAERLKLSGKLINLRRLLVGVMSIKQEVLQRFCDLIPDIRIINGYGPTETTICATFFPFVKAINPNENTPIGKPVGNYKAYILSPGKKLVPAGVPGELYISGDGVARGYLNNPTLTHQKFIEDPFSPGKIMYATGDLARWWQDGNIEYLGRKDDQVKINGYRIEPGEIENVLRQSGLVTASAILVVNDAQGNKALAAYVIPTGSFSQQELIRHLQRHLPQYMVPRLWIQLEAFPMTPNGKIDRCALMDRISKEKLMQDYVAPRNEVEEGLAALWQQLLQADRVGAYDNFFFLGGNSVSAMQLTFLLKKKFNLQVPVKIIFQLPYLHDLAEYIDIMQEKEPAETDLAGYEVFEL
jgi:amino acid adenylation domain-containing protein/non-ribosomal peptide synthase protein (TIGR01720 family)